MRKFAVYAIALSLALMIVPAASADSAGVAVCGDYDYGDDDSEAQSFGISVSDDGSASTDEPDEGATQQSVESLAADLADGDAEEDDDGAVWDVGPDPVDGSGFVHVSLTQNGEEEAGAGSDDLSDEWSTSCA